MPKNYPFLLAVKGEKQGTIKSSIKSSGKSKHGDWGGGEGIECYGFNYEPLSSFDSASGLPTGKRTHSPITIIREVDAASPLLMQALVTNEAIQTATFSFARPSPGGNNFGVQTIELTNGLVAKVVPYHGAGLGAGKRWQKVTLTYESIKVNGVPNGIIPRLMMS
jgi:type VI secretion system secreted protein Hcp